MDTMTVVGVVDLRIGKCLGFRHQMGQLSLSTSFQYLETDKIKKGSSQYRKHGTSPYWLNVGPHIDKSYWFWGLI
jgi:hypothetical protein